MPHLTKFVQNVFKEDSKFKKTMANNSLVLSTFLKQLDECLEDIILLYPTQTARDSRFLKCKMYFDALKKSNPRLMIHVWKTRVNEKYRTQIDAKNVNFFIEELDYRQEAPQSYDDEVESALEDMRWTIRQMSEDNIEKCMRYIQNLCKLADLYQL